MSVRAFAAHLGVSGRMVSKWEAGGASIRPRSVNQAALDTSLAQADPITQSRFHLARTTSAPASTVDDGIVEVAAAGARCVLRHPDDGKLMALVPAGIARLGPDSRPHWVGGFFMDVYPTSHADYARFVAATGHRLPPSPGRGHGATHPVVGVTAADAVAYARWAGKELPTAQQWEKAARGPAGNRYPWGNDFNSLRCNVRESRINATTPVAWYTGAASPYGIVDLWGNVWEWCTTADGMWQTRGGSFATPAQLVTSSSWQSHAPTVCRDDLGFRCVISLDLGLELLSI
jgi:hypothetical protein